MPHQRPAPTPVNGSDGTSALEVTTVTLDGQGHITAASPNWFTAAQRRGLSAEAVGLGTNYLAVCDRATGPGSEYAWRAAQGIRSVLTGERQTFYLDYPCHLPGESNWFTMRVQAGGNRAAGAIVTHSEITHILEAVQTLRGETTALWRLAPPNAEFVTLVGLDGEVIAGAPDHEAVLGDRPWYGESVFDVIHPADARRAEDAFAACLTVPGTSVGLTVRIRDTDDRWRCVDVTGHNMADDPEVGGILVTGIDLTDLRRTQVAHLLWDRLVDRLPAGILVTDELGIVLVWNEQAEALFGIAVEDAVGRDVRDLFGDSARANLAAAAACIAEGRTWEGEQEIVDGDSSRVLFVQLQPLVDEDSGFEGVLAVAADRTEQRRLRDLLDHQDTHDLLTGLCNRDRFVDELRERLRTGRTGHTVAVVSLDGFRGVNLSVGARRGDEILRAVARCLEQIADHEMVARLHGDVFALLVTSSLSPAELGDRLGATIRRVAEDEDVELTASIGMREIDADERDAEAVIDSAFDAVADVKAAGGGGAASFDPALRRAALERLALERDLRRALRQDALTVEYQPTIRLSDGAICEVEALVRWRDEVRGSVPPDRFIAAAERCGAIDEIFELVLHDACRSIARWRAVRPELPVRAAVNLSPVQLRDPGLADQIRREVEAAGIDPSLLIVELTESMLMEDHDRSSRQMAALKSVGIRLAIDDFGTGHSSLARLKSMPLDVLKIDRSFTEAVGSRAEDDSIVQTIVTLAACFGLDVVAEGVETEEQRDALARLGCTFGQGFLWSPSVGPDEIDRMLTTTHGPADLTHAPTDGFGTSACAEVLYAVRHELATPLASLAHSIQLLSHLEEPTTAGAVARMQASIDRLAHITRSMDLVHRLDRGTLVAAQGEVRPTALVEQVAAEVGAGVGRSLDVEVDDDAAGLVVRGDHDLLAQALANVLTNAIKYSPSGSPIATRVRRRGDDVEISVVDRGPGLSPRQVGAAWRKFGRGDHATAGAGLGLYLARGIARAHRGELSYRNAVPNGSDFYFRLPIG